jgi:hypothetical protein
MWRVHKSFLVLSIDTNLQTDRRELDSILEMDTTVSWRERPGSRSLCHGSRMGSLPLASWGVHSRGSSAVRYVERDCVGCTRCDLIRKNNCDRKQPHPELMTSQKRLCWKCIRTGSKMVTHKPGVEACISCLVCAWRHSNSGLTLSSGRKEAVSMFNTGGSMQGVYFFYPVPLKLFSWFVDYHLKPRFMFWAVVRIRDSVDSLSWKLHI